MKCAVNDVYESPIKEKENVTNKFALKVKSGLHVLLGTAKKTKKTISLENVQLRKQCTVGR